MAQQKAFICGCEGFSLSEEEKTFLARERPWGFILFKRNVDTRAQLRQLVADLRTASGSLEAPVFIDQEGGRVQRLGPPHWISYPPGKAFADLCYKDTQKGRRAAFLAARLIAHDLREAGIDGNCLPILDVPTPEGHEVIGDRAYGTDSTTVSTLGLEIGRGLLEGGVLPVIKHIPGHGRASADSHIELPVVETDTQTLSQTDFVPFQNLAHYPMAMTAHVVYAALDPDQPCSTSRTIIASIIREKIGFQGLLMSDDVSMNALDGDIAVRTAACFAAGCDIVLHCNGKMEEMKAVAANAPFLADIAARRAEAALAWRSIPKTIDVEALRAELNDLLS